MDLAFTRIWSWDQRQKRCRKPCGWSLEPTEDWGYTNRNNTRYIPRWAVICVTFLYKTMVCWFGELLVTKEFPPGLSKSQKENLWADAKYYFWDTPYLWKFCVDQVVRRCVPQDEFHSILTFCHSHSCGGHFGAKRTAHEVLESGFYWRSIFKDAYHFCKSCEKCQRTGNITHKNHMPLTNILVSEIFYVWGIDFMGPFPSSFISFLVLIMCPNGLRRKPHELTMLRLF